VSGGRAWGAEDLEPVSLGDGSESCHVRVALGRPPPTDAAEKARFDCGAPSRRPQYAIATADLKHVT
jgi:hypothetical protein